MPNYVKGNLRAPFPWFGGKYDIASTVWRALGNPEHFIEPFFGSGAVLLARPHNAKVETVNDADGMLCLAPETRVLTPDLRWKAIGDVAVGEELLAFDESNGSARVGLRAPLRYRHYAIGLVEAVQRVVKPCYRLTFDDETTVVASEDHLWLGGSHKSGGRGWRWVSTKGMVCNRATQKSWVLKFCDVVQQELSFDAGWLSGFYDGEGHLRTGPGWRLNVCQKLGAEAERVASLLGERGFAVSRSVRNRASPEHHPVEHFEINGGMRETLRFLMLARPERLIRRFAEVADKMSLYGRSHQAVGLVSKEYLGEMEVVALQTSTRTFIAEGLASHNCNFWRAVAAEPEVVAAHADWPTNEADLHARHLWLVNRRHAVTRLMADPDAYDAKAAGWWVWGLCNWIGGGWCSGDGPWVGVDGELVDSRQLPHLSAGRGINRQLPHLSAGRGINRKLPHMGDAGRGSFIADWFVRLSDRLRGVRVACGDWSRVCGPSVLRAGAGTCGVFLDPPYALDERAEVYSHESHAAAEARNWCLEYGGNRDIRIVLAGYDGEHNALEANGWRAVRWKARGGYGSRGEGRGRENCTRETLWLSPHCVMPDQMVQESLL